MDELMRRANNGDVEAEAELARKYAISGDFASSVQWNLRAASHGSPAAMLALSSLYRNGNGVPANMDEANKWLLKAADANAGAALLSISSYYESGEAGFPKDPVKAFYYIEKMANLKGWDSYGRFMLANYYYNGFGTSPNPDRALSLWEALGNEGYADACYKMALVYALGKGRPQNPDIAVQWAQAALNSNDTAVMKLETVQEKAQSLLNTLYNSNGDNSSSESSGGCYIATAVYGSYDCPQVWVLRRFRDYRLAKTWYGRAFIKTYYTISPTLVRLFGNSSWFIGLWKPRLDKMVNTLKEEGFDDTPYHD